ncbi:hypothetical protein HRbin28_02412 [bacterium HR28]|jgi:hypothetical protein|nr:hypothetical protein HRbin28_02412 [bacterium HR28]
MGTQQCAVAREKQQSRGKFGEAVHLTSIGSELITETVQEDTDG